MRSLTLPMTLLAAAALLAAQASDPRSAARGPRLPNGRSLQEELLKAEHKQSLKDVTQMIELSEELKEELEKNERHIVSVSSIRKTEEIEKLAKRIRARLKRY